MRPIAAIIAALSLAACAHQPPPAAPPPPAPPPPPPDLHALFERAITDAAVKKPGFVVDLTPVTGKTDVQLVTLYKEGETPIDPKTRMIMQPLMVALPDELAQRCRNRHGDPLVALGEILGLPPIDKASGEDWQLSVFTVSPKRLFRPCASSPDITTKTCSLDIARANGSQADFIYRTSWLAYQSGTGQPGRAFTGMGWTYDWGPEAPASHVGVSEYVVRAQTRAANIRDLTPQQFCQTTDAPSTDATPPSPPAASPAPPTH